MMNGRSRWFPVRFHVRLFGFELTAVVVAALVLLAAAVIVRSRLLDVAPDPACLRALWLSEEMAGCRDATEYVTRSGDEGDRVMTAFGLVPLLVAGLLGAIAGARDLDEGAAPLSWSLYRSRLRWLAQRAVLVTAVVVAISAVCMAGAGMLADARLLIAPVGETFRDYGLVSAPVVLRSVVVMAFGLLVGLALGRQLPALLVATAFAVALPMGLGAVMPYGEPLRVVSAPEHQASDEARLGLDLWMGYQMWQARDGALYLESEALAGAPTPNDYAGTLAWLDENFDQVDFVLPGSSRQLVELRECAMLGAVSGGLLLVSAVVVRRRRPY